MKTVNEEGRSFDNVFDAGQFMGYGLENFLNYYPRMPIIVATYFNKGFNFGARALADRILRPKNVQDQELASREGCQVCPYYSPLRRISELLGIPGELVDIRPSFCTVGKNLSQTYGRENAYCQTLLAIVNNLVTIGEEYGGPPGEIAEEIGALSKFVDPNVFDNAFLRQRAILFDDFAEITGMSIEKLQELKQELDEIVGKEERRAENIEELHAIIRMLLKGEFEGEKKPFHGCPKMPFLPPYMEPVNQE